jgi:hypothetical protein
MKGLDMESLLAVPKAACWVSCAIVLSLLMVLGCTPKGGASLGVNGASKRTLKSTRDTFVRDLRKILANKTLDLKERMDAAVMLGRVGDSAGPRFLITEARAAEDSKEILNSIFLMRAIATSACSNELISELCNSEDATLQLAGVCMATGGLNKKSVQAVRSIQWRSKDYYTCAIALNAIGRHGTPKDIADVCEVAKQNRSEGYVTEACKEGLAAFLGGDGEITPDEFVVKLQNLIKSIEALDKPGASDGQDVSTDGRDIEATKKQIAEIEKMMEKLATKD